MKGNKKMKRKGFTLIELLVVIAIIGLLSTLSVVSLNSARGRARDAAKKSDMNAISTALELYNVEVGNYPGIDDDCGNGAGNILAKDTPSDNIICSGSSIITENNDVLLQAIPASPDDTDYLGFVDEDFDNYCISAQLEDETYFRCVNGSCYVGAVCSAF